MDRFTSAVPAAQVEAFLDRLVPSATDRALALATSQAPAQARATLEAALVAYPSDGRLAVALAQLLVQEDPPRAEALLTPHWEVPGADRVRGALALAAVAARDPEELRVAAAAGDVAATVDLGRLLVARGAVDEALEAVLVALEGSAAGDEAREPLRTGLLELLTLLGDDPRVGPARARMARALF
jgi:thioredoxin-like negative regulator of GroEL